MASSFYHGFDTRHWNPLVGCDHGAKFGCLAHCWAAPMVARWGEAWGIGSDFRPRLVEKWLKKPLSWRKPQVVATGFMGDIACLDPHEIGKIFDTMAATPQHTYLLLTKDPDRLRSKTVMGNFDGPFPSNVMACATVRNQEDADRVIPALFRIPAAKYALSLEPLLGPVDLDAPFKCVGMDSNGPRRMVSWVAGGCESGRGARWCDADWTLKAWVTMPHDAAGNLDNSKLDWPVLDWLRSARDQCAAAGVPFWCKQVPVFKDGKWVVSDHPADFPADLRVQERPAGFAKKGGA